MYVANSGNGGSNYTGFRLCHGGRLEPIVGSAVALPDGSQPGDVLFNGNGTKLAGTSHIDTFTVGENGRLTAAAGSPFPAQGLGPFGSELGPTNPDQPAMPGSGRTAVARPHTEVQVGSAAARPPAASAQHPAMNNLPACPVLPEMRIHRQNGPPGAPAGREDYTTDTPQSHPSPTPPLATPPQEP